MKKITTVLFILLAGYVNGQSLAVSSANSLPDTLSVVNFKSFLGVNAFEWNFLQDEKDHSIIDEPRMAVIKSFGAVRHYLDWDKIEKTKGKYSFNPTTSGSWNLDAIYQRCKSDSIDVLVCVKTCPDWIMSTYPANERDRENVPAPYGLNREKPSTYVDQARAGFQFAARYGYNKNIDSTLLSVNTTPRWKGDPVNTIKIGMSLIKYIECDNERDKWWKGTKAQQSAAEYAANLSAFYDGDKGKLGKGVGVKSADPNMLVVMAGLAKPDVGFVRQMIEWCKIHRGRRANGSIDLCWDVINYHLYSNDHLQNKEDKATVGVAPELSETGKLADEFVSLGKEYNLPVWVTEAGYDINPKSPQRAIQIGNKPIAITQADWLLRTALLYARHGIKRLFFYELYDDNIQSSTQYASSGLAVNAVKRPAANYINQAKFLLNGFHYKSTISNNPLVDLYESESKIIYVLTIGSSSGKSINYKLNLKATSPATVYSLTTDSDKPLTKLSQVVDSSVVINVSETPIFVETDRKNGE